MRVLGIGDSCELGSMYLQLMAAGHEVRACVRDDAEAAPGGVMDGLLPRGDARQLGSLLDWVRSAGDDGYLVFETANDGAQQDALRREGFFVIGGSAEGDRLEADRTFGQSVLRSAGMLTATTHTFDDFELASAFIRARPRRYVFKLNGNATSSWRNCVGQAADGSDMLALLQGQRARLAAIGEQHPSFVLMDHLDGVETGVGAYFDGEQFLTPACIDWEHKRLFNDDLGELTGEMGTLVSYEGSSRLFDETLGKLAPQLHDAGYIGYINLNTIINDAGVWPLELTCRFGYPGFAILSALQVGGWAEIFRALRFRQLPRTFATTPGYAVGVVLTVPPFPYRYGYEHISRGLPITLDVSLGAAELANLHFGELARVDAQLVASGSVGYLMVATGVGANVADAQARAYALARKVYVPNLRYRTDIGAAFEASGRHQLQRLGYLP